MAKTKTRKVYVKAKRRRRNNGVRLPLAVIAGFAPLLANTWGHWRTYGATGATRYMSQALTGYDPQTSKWNFNNLGLGLFPIIVGIFAHKVAGRLGVNRAIASTGLPWIRI